MKYGSSTLTHWAARNLPDDEARYRLLIEKIICGRELLFSYNPIPFSSKYGGLRAKDVWGAKMVCFTDMPLSVSFQHLRKYCRFGVVFHKAPLANCCVCPVAYTLNPFIYEAYSYLYHVAVGLKPLVDGKTLSAGRYAGEIFSFEGYMQKLHHFLLWTQDYSQREFPYREGAVTAGPEQMGFFEDADAFYYEREWRAVFRPGDRFPWVVEHDDNAYFRFDGASVQYLVVPDAFCQRAESDLRASYGATKPPEVVPFEGLETGRWDR